MSSSAPRVRLFPYARSLVIPSIISGFSLGYPRLLAVGDTIDHVSGRVACVCCLCMLWPGIRQAEGRRI